MKKLSEFIKPYLAIAFGALLFLFYLNWLGSEGAFLAVGIIAIVFAAGYLAVGILGVVFGERLPKVLKLVFDIFTVSAFPLLIFVYFIVLVTSVPVENIGPAGWVILIVNLAASLGLVGLYITTRFVKVKLLDRITYLFAVAFILALALNLVFDFTGDPIVLGNITVVELIIDALYSYMLINALKKEAK